MDKKQARKHLTEADKELEAGKARIAKQEERVRELAADGHEVDTAKEMLRKFQEMEEVMTAFRDILREELRTRSDK